jgi:hypothetical protein
MAPTFLTSVINWREWAALRPFHFTPSVSASISCQIRCCVSLSLDLDNMEEYHGLTDYFLSNDNSVKNILPWGTINRLGSLESLRPLENPSMSHFPIQGNSVPKLSPNLSPIFSIWGDSLWCTACGSCKKLCKSWGFDGGDYEEWSLLGCYAVWLL